MSTECLPGSREAEGAARVTELLAGVAIWTSPKSGPRVVSGWKSGWRYIREIVVTAPSTSALTKTPAA